MYVTGTKIKFYDRDNRERYWRGVVISTSNRKPALIKLELKDPDMVRRIKDQLYLPSRRVLTHGDHTFFVTDQVITGVQISNLISLDDTVEEDVAEEVVEG